jgi:hypothetical protein
MAAENRKVTRSQYHHYVPRFLLRRFSSPSPNVLAQVKRRNKRQRDDDLVTAVDLLSDNPEFVTKPVGRIFGQLDMYKDDSKFSEEDQKRIETKLSLIEGQASRIIAQVADAHKAGKNEVTLSRHDKDLLRKFLFIMKYRSPNFYDRYNHQKAEDYNSDDRIPFLEYMLKNNFKRPLDVWFDNLLKIIEKRMDPAGKWITDLFKEIYPGDALWLSIHIQSMYMSFATPSDTDEEFLLTSNAFGIYEGPVSRSINRYTGKQTTTAYTEFHIVSVVSPRLIMILRHNLLPEPLEDKRIDKRNKKRLSLALEMQAHSDPSKATSLLQDLPVAKARKSYTEVQNGRLILAKKIDKLSRSTDQFHFTFFRLESRHVQMINLVMLDQAHNSSHIVFMSKAALRAALEFYLDFPTQTSGIYSLKTITERLDDPTLLMLRKLERIAHSLGSSVRARYHIDPLVEPRNIPFLDDTSPFDDIVGRVLKKTKNELPMDNVFAWTMPVMVQVLVELKLNIITIHALHQVCIANDRHDFPTLIFRAIHKADTRSLNEHTTKLLNVDSWVWTAGWDALVERALEVPGVDLDHIIQNLRNNLAQVAIRPNADLFLNVMCSMCQKVLRRPEEAPVQQPISNSNVEADPSSSRPEVRTAFKYLDREDQDKEDTSPITSPPDTPSETFPDSSWSRPGLRKAFEYLGRDDHDEETTSTVPSLQVTQSKPFADSRHETKNHGTPHTRNADRRVQPTQDNRDRDNHHIMNPYPPLPSGEECRMYFIALIIVLSVLYSIVTFARAVAADMWSLAVAVWNLPGDVWNTAVGIWSTAVWVWNLSVKTWNLITYVWNYLF